MEMNQQKAARWSCRCPSPVHFYTTPGYPNTFRAALVTLLAEELWHVDIVIPGFEILE